MTLFRSLVLRHFRQEPVRSALTVLGVALGIAVVLGIRLANVSALRGFETAIDTMAGATSVEVVGPALGIDETWLPELGWLREYGVVSPVIEGDALSEPDGASGGDRAASEMLRVLGIDILRDQPLRSYRLTGAAGEGRTPSAQEFLTLLLDPRAVILTERYARRVGVEVGSKLWLTMGDRREAFTVRGLLADEGPARVLDGNFALMDIAAAQLALDRLGRIDRLDVRLAEGLAIDAAEAAIAARLPDVLRVQRPSRRGQQVEQLLAAFHLNLTALSYVALLVGLFLVYNTVSASVVARRTEIGTLRALGLSRASVVWLFLGEALALAVPGCVLGVVFGQALAHGAVALTAQTVSVLYVASAAAAPALGPADVLLAFGIGLPLSLVAAALPAREASRVSPLAAIRGHDLVDTRVRLPVRRLFGPVALVGLGAWLARFDPIGGLPLAGYAAALAFVLGAAGLVPGVLFVLARFGGPIVGRLFGVAGLLAHGNLAGAIPRLSVSVAALAVSLSMMVAIAVMIGSFRETVVHWVGQTLRADLFVGPATRSEGARQATISPEVDEIVARHPAVAAVDRFRNVAATYRDGSIVLGSGDFAVLLARGELLFKAPADARAAMQAAIDADAAVVSEAFSLKHGHVVGDEVALPTRTGLTRFRVAAVYYDYSSDRGVVMMDRGTFARHFGEAASTGLTVYLRDGADAAAIRADLLSGLGERHRVYIYTNQALRAEVLRIFDATFAITYALELIAVFVAMLGVTGTLATLILERRRELAMLRLVGADRRQVRSMVVIEAGMMGGVSQAIGLVVGLLLSLVLIYVVNVQSFGWTIQFHLPLGFLAQMSVVILVATSLAGLYPARRAASVSMAEQVTEE